MRIISVEFESADLSRAESFYGSLLGLPITRENGTLTIRAGSSSIVLRQGFPDRGRQHLAFSIPRLMFDSAREWIADRVPLLVDGEGRDEFEASPQWNARSLYFADPDGNILEFIVRRDITDDQDGSFGPGLVQCISEVGIAVDDVPGLAASAASVFGISNYGKGGPTFQPVGDIEGLFILVTRGRHWFPTDTPAGTRHLRVHVESGWAGTLEPATGIEVRSTGQTRT